MRQSLPPDALERSLWFHTARETAGYASLADDVTADVAVIGGGIMGLSAALALAEGGRSVVVLEADRIGAGASGRNGGNVVPAFPRVGPAEVLRILGTAGEPLLRMVAGAADEVFSLVRRHGIDCDAVQKGWLNPAHVPAVVPTLARRVAEWQGFGGRSLMLDAAETRARFGADGYFGALLDPTGGHLNPLAYTRGLARAAAGAGARIHENARVERTERTETGWRLRTAAGGVTAGTVLQCTNAYPPALAEPSVAAVARSFVPITIYQLATRPFDPAMRARLLPGNEFLTDTRNRLFAVRWTADNRLIRAGMVSIGLGAIDRLPAAIGRRLQAKLPFLGPIVFDYIWRGRAAVMPDYLPRLFEVAPAWYAPFGCNGRGIALSTALGNRVGRFVLSGDPGVVPVAITAPKPIRRHFLVRYAPNVLVALHSWQDYRTERAARADAKLRQGAARAGPAGAV